MSLGSDAISLGLPVFPCGSDKRPVISHGFKSATADPGEIASIFATPGATLIGVPTGELTGFDVLDVDPRHGGSAWLAENECRLPETRIHQTQGGGRHYLFRHAPGVRNSAAKVAPGIDVRGEGGYIVAPPSPGYQVIHEADIAEWPDWLLELVLPRPDPRPYQGRTHAAGELDSKRLDGFVRSVLDRVSRAPEGGKHFVLRNAALSLGGIQEAAGLSDQRAGEMLLAALPQTVKDWKGAAKTIAWGLERGRGKPIELEDRRPLNGHTSEPPPIPTDPGWFSSLEVRLAEDGEPVPDWETSAQPPQTSADDDIDPAIDSRIIDPTKDWLAPAPLREWVIDGWIPRGYVTGIYGDGGVGKSLLVQQLLTSVALGLPWLGLSVVGGRAFGMMCEDDSKELHRRQESINGAYQVRMENLEMLRIAPRLGCDNLLMTFDQHNHPHLTELFADLCRYLSAFRPTLVVLDTLADIFGGNELSRQHARAFVQGVGGRIARRWNCAVVIPAHPSASGLSTGSGTSGSTAWNNTFRSRLYMRRPDDEGDGDTRLLSRMKANYAPKKAEITCRWHQGAFVTSVPDNTAPAYGKRLEWRHIDVVFDEIERAWGADEAWSAQPQTRKHGRYLPLWVQVHLGIEERVVARYLDSWLASGHLKAEIIDNRTKARGLRVIKRLQPKVDTEVSAEVEE